MREDSFCEYLKWDSEFFGINIARALPSRLSQKVRDAIEQKCRAENIDCVYFLADADDPETARVAEATGFNMVDIRVTLKRRILNQIPESSLTPSDGLVRPATREDLTNVRLIARHSHRDSRFYFDVNFSHAKCDLLYETWIQNSCSGCSDAVFVAEHQQRASGYITCNRLDEHTGQIGLFAVDGPAQNLGFGSALVCKALRWFRDQGIEDVEVVTQGRNVDAQRCYQRWGFLTHRVQVWYHWWSSPEIRPRKSLPLT